jgi:hypothetical protein
VVVAVGGRMVVVVVLAMAFSTAAAALGTVVDRAMVDAGVGDWVEGTGSGTVVVGTTKVPPSRPAAVTRPSSLPPPAMFMTPADTTPMISRMAVAHASHRAVVGGSPRSSTVGLLISRLSHPSRYISAGQSPDLRAA